MCDFGGGGSTRYLKASKKSGRLFGRGLSLWLLLLQIGRDFNAICERMDLPCFFLCAIFMSYVKRKKANALPLNKPLSCPSICVWQWKDQKLSEKTAT